MIDSNTELMERLELFTNVLVKIQLMHRPTSESGLNWCIQCTTAWPCTTIKLIEDMTSEVNEDELPDDITDAEYDWWFERSYLSMGSVGVRVGPKLNR